MKYSDAEVTKAVKECTSWAQVARLLTGRNLLRTGHQSHFKMRAVRIGLDFSHFPGQGWNRGRVFGPKRPIECYLVKNGPFVKSHDLKNRLIREGVKQHKCEACGLTEWMGMKIPIELDHVDGDHWNNEILNLRILCPNCHAQTQTYCGKNI